MIIIKYLCEVKTIVFPDLTKASIAFQDSLWLTKCQICYSYWGNIYILVSSHKPSYAVLYKLF